jgi:uncharacterized iron-regulated membrane protein
MKRWLLRLHRWSGLLIAAIVVIVGCTGALTTYQHEVDSWLNRDLLWVDAPDPRGPSQRALALDQLVAAAEATLQGTRATAVRLPQSRRESVEVSVAPFDANGFAGRYVYVEPYLGTVLGSRPFDPEPWSRRGVVASVYEVHYSLAASRVGVWLVSAVAAVWLMTTLCGVALAWPRSWEALRRTLRVRTGGLVQFNHDLHRLTGLLAAPLLVVVLATGVALNLSPQATGLVQQFSPLTFEPNLLVRAPATAGGASGWQAALDAAVAAQPAAQPYSLYLDPARSVYVVRMREADAIHRRGQTRVYIAMDDASVLAVWNPRQGSAGDRFWGWQNPLHSGYAAGAVGRLLVFVSGLAAMLFVFTGVPLWFARRPARER